MSIAKSPPIASSERAASTERIAANRRRSSMRSTNSRSASAGSRTKVTIPSATHSRPDGWRTSDGYGGQVRPSSDKEDANGQDRGPAHKNRGGLTPDNALASR